MTELQSEVQRTLDALVESGAERGVQVSVRRGGEVLADAVAGVADPATGRAMTPGTPIYGWSIGKAVTATIVHILADRGDLGYDTPVAEPWPEFAAHGKGNVTVRHVLTHTAGVPGIPLDTTVEDVCDSARMSAAVAAEKPWWPAGEQTGYHAYTFGYILGEVIQRVTGRPLAQVLREEITEPLGIADELYFGVPRAEQHRLAVLEDAPPPADAPEGDPSAEMPADLPLFRSAPMELFPAAEMGNRPDVLGADIPAGAKTSARAITALYDALLTGRLVSPARLTEATSVAVNGIDQVFGNPVRWGLGFALGWPVEGDETLTVFGMGGAGGSYAAGDTATGVSVAFTKNRLSPDFATTAQVLDTVRAHLPA
ncbi:serine hydrolase domain-containing protein [Actinomadura flavalba]|uniref:serine hydrolase domain-containing protein n=1 Tax=Actinomadura flavalba TaxID=1120938 RepID=UPI000375CB4E|nr:serine hydrolase domain-containing protein [Actinomadura flavalba]